MRNRRNVSAGSGPFNGTSNTSSTDLSSSAFRNLFTARPIRTRSAGHALPSRATGRSHSDGMVASSVIEQP
eukprot:797220-Rhodomonas_salina.6